jgi:MFS family permease
MTIPWLRQLSQIIPAAVLFGVGFGTVMPTLYSALADLTPSDLRSSVLAVGTGVGYLGQFLCPILLGFVLSHSGLPEVFYSAASIALVTALLLLIPITDKSAGTTG